MARHRWSLLRARLGARALWHRGRTHDCPCCARGLRGFLEHRGRPEVRCPVCGSLERHRLLWLHLGPAIAAEPPRRLLHLGPGPAIAWALDAHPEIEVRTGDLLREDVDLTLDLCALDLDDASFDAIICVHVLEHVRDDRLAMRELRRVLSPGGWLAAMVPMSPEPETHEDPGITDPEARRRAFGQPDHLRLHGQDFPDRLRDAGFTVEAHGTDGLSATEIQRMRLKPESVFLARKT